MNQQFDVTIIDEWPKMRIIVKRGPNVRTEGPIQYDTAASGQFEPAVRDALRLCIEEVIKSRKRSS